MRWHVGTGLAFTALKDIAAGEELTFCYDPRVDLRADFQTRRQTLTTNGWKFVCSCARCVAEQNAFLARTRKPADDEASDDSDDAPMGGGGSSDEDSDLGF